jgi:hypothetical protein
MSPLERRRKKYGKYIPNITNITKRERLIQLDLSCSNVGDLIPYSDKIPERTIKRYIRKYGYDGDFVARTLDKEKVNLLRLTKKPKTIEELNLIKSQVVQFEPTDLYVGL